MTTLTVIGARVVIVGEPFTELAGLLDGTGIQAVTIADLAAGDPSEAPDVHARRRRPGRCYS